ncbi:MAG: AAA family ATPase [Candidatus Aenigmarchaeota archaeon]|nr:AAA family ATPase [Candidatus Aenigmarchaeota archaeon]
MALFILGITGKRGAGKDTVADYLKKRYGFRVLNYTEHVLSPILRERNKKITRSNLINLALDLRKKYGNDILTKKIAELIKGYDKWVISGMRYPEEYYYLKSEFGERFKLIHIECSTQTRYERIKKRGTKGEASISFREFLKIEDAETEKAIDMIIELADLSITNDGTLEELYKKIDRMVARHFGLRPV